jgi:hypothetical protein
MQPIASTEGSDAWGIARLADVLVGAGTQPSMIAPGFVTLLSDDDGTQQSFTVPAGVFDVAVDGEWIWVSGQLDSAPYVAAYDSEGTLIDDTAGSALPPAGTAWDLAVGADGSIHVAAADAETGVAWIGAVSMGDLAWSTAWGVRDAGAAYGISHTPGDELVATGSAGTLGIVSVLDPNDGAERWSQTLASSRESFANIHKAAGGPAGEVVAVGWVSTSSTDADVWIGKYATDGALLWERTFAGTGEIDSNGWGVAVDAMGHITAVGGLANATYDAWVVRLEP